MSCGQVKLVSATQPTIRYVSATPTAVYTGVSQVQVVAEPTIVQSEPVLIEAQQVTQIAVAEAQTVAVASAAAATVELPPLPPVNSGCYAPPVVAAGVNTRRVVQLPTEERVVETNDADVQTVVRENNNYTTLNKTVVTQVNRNHLHTQRIVNNENQHNTYVTNNVVKVNDIHRTRVENVKGETRVINDHRQTQTVEQPRCLRAADGTLVNCN